MTELTLDAVYAAQPGDTFSFTSPSNNTQYRINVVGASRGVVIGVWDASGKGKARNKPGQNYVDRTLTKGVWTITVINAENDYKIAIKKRSWWEKVFG